MRIVNQSSHITPHHAHPGLGHPEETVSPESSNTFPFLLYGMLEDAPSHGFDHIVSWLPTGDGFKVHDRLSFERQIMGKYFENQTKYKSFLRQLNFYGFNRITRGAQKGCLYHDMFKKGSPSLCHSIKRETRVCGRSEEGRRSCPPMTIANDVKLADKSRRGAAIIGGRQKVETYQHSSHSKDDGYYWKHCLDSSTADFSEVLGTPSWCQNGGTGHHETMKDSSNSSTERHYFKCLEESQRRRVSSPLQATTPNNSDDSLNDNQGQLATGSCFEGTAFDGFKGTRSRGAVMIADDDIASEIIATFCF